MLQLTLPSKLPSGRTIDDIRVHKFEGVNGSYRIMKFTSGWTVCFVYPSGLRRPIVVNCPIFDDAKEAYQKHYIKSLNEHIAKLKEELSQ